MHNEGSTRRVKLNLDDLHVETFDPMSFSPSGDGTIRGLDSWVSCPTECESTCQTLCASCEGGCSDFCATFDTCPAACASTVQMC